jgi:hypothetical protein
MSAKEMFEKLGYARDESYDGILYSKYVDENESVNLWQIDFDKVNKTVEKSVSKAGFDMKYWNSKITSEELKAINKQVEELGW